MMKLGDVAREYKEKHTGPKEGVPVVGLEHLTPDDLSLSSWSDNQNNTFTKAFKTGHILFGRRRAYQRKAAIAPFDGICSGDITVIEAIPNKINPDLLPFLIHNHHFFDYAVGMSAGSMSPRVKWEYLKEYRFRLEPVESQCQAAQILKTANELKLSYLRLLSATDEIVKSRFVEMFGDMKSNPMKWEIAPFSQFAVIDGGLTTDYDAWADFPHIGIDSIMKDTGELVGYRTVSEDGVKSGKYVFTPEHIIYSKIRPNLNKVALPSFTGLCSADAYPILPNKTNCNRTFLAFVMRSPYFLDYILPHSTRTNMPKVNRAALGGFTMPLPPLALQQKFEVFVEKTDKSKFTLQHNIEKLNDFIQAFTNQIFGLNEEDDTTVTKE